MPIFSIRDEEARERLGNAANHIPHELRTVSDGHGGTREIAVGPAWESAYLALMFRHAETLAITDPDESAAFQEFAEEHAPGALVVENVVDE